MTRPKFERPRNLGGLEITPNLYVANCGPAVEISFEKIESEFGKFGEVIGVHAADESGARVIVCFRELSAAKEAFKRLNGSRCVGLGGRSLHIRYSVPQKTPEVRKALSVSFSATELAIPGIFLVHDFITPEQEEDLLACVDSRPWRNLSKRRVQHYGYEFLYETRNVDSRQFLGGLPSFVSLVLDNILSFPGLNESTNKTMDQLTVNEYPPGVGLSPHIDTHSAFEELIFSLSLAGPCIMEFRKYVEGYWPSSPPNFTDEEENSADSNLIRKAVFLPPRSMLLMSGEGRYAWQHYIPHHKVDLVGEQAIRRYSRRVSFTFRKVRKAPCCCQYLQYCDSQNSSQARETETVKSEK